jgi:3-hydroxy-9,10-secoandrosta-1,3,5(10)-triene-9,17-dione monooxygenase reductase component
MIHSDHPFRPVPEDRDQARRFRGRLAAGVSIVTAGPESKRTGLTVSSLLVIEGDPPLAELVVGPTTDLWATVKETGRFVIHVCLAPSPGGMFTGTSIDQTEWGPVLADLRDRAYCSYQSAREAGWSGVISGRIDRVEISDLTDPMIHFRSGYRRLSPGR